MALVATVCVGKPELVSQSSEEMKADRVWCSRYYGGVTPYQSPQQSRKQLVAQSRQIFGAPRRVSGAINPVTTHKSLATFYRLVTRTPSPQK
jgi:hypothetical protein